MYESSAIKTEDKILLMFLIKKKKIFGLALTPVRISFHSFAPI